MALPTAPTPVQPNLNRKMKAMIFGPYGSGKTTLIATADEDPRTMPMALIDFEGGTESISDKTIDIFHVTSWPEYDDLYAYLSRGDHPYKSIGLDSLSETHVFALFDILDKEGPGRKNEDLIEVGDYGIASVQIRRLMGQFRDLDMHVFFTSLSREDVDPRQGTITIPALSGKLAKEVPGIVNTVAYLSPAQDEAGNECRALILKGYPKIGTKIRVPREWLPTIPNELVDPTITQLMDVLRFE